jgi:MFS family permease
MTKLIYSVLLCHFIAAFAALGMPLFLPVVLPTLGASIDADWAGVLFILPTFCTALAARFWGNFADRYGRRRSLLRAQLGLAAGFALCGLADNLAMFVFGLIVQGTFGGTMAASNSYLSSQIKEAKTLGKSLNKTQLSARLALIVAPIGLGWSLSETNPLNAYLWLCVLPLIAMGITLTLPADKPADQNLEKPNSEPQQEKPVAQKNAMHAIRWIFLLNSGLRFLWW